eukprot:scaffold49271_cov87-Attheya_sp.AAC.1
MGHLVVSNTSQVHKRLESGQVPITRYMQNQSEQDGTAEPLETPQHTVLVVLEMIEQPDAVEPLVEDDDERIIRSCDKSDVWHELYDVPLEKGCPASPNIFQLLLRGTLAANEVEENNVQAVLVKRGWTRPYL